MRFNVKNAGLRTLAYAGARYGPRPWIEYSPAFFGALFACLLGEERRTVRRNLKRLLGDRPYVTEQLDVLRTFVSYAHCLAESLAMDRPEAHSAEPAVVGVEHLDAALAGGRGVVLVTAHTGAWDAAARSLTRDRDLEVTVVMAAEPDADARMLHDSVRGRAGISIVHSGQEPLDALKLLRRLRDGGAVAVQLDRAASADGNLRPLLGGVPLPVPEGPFRLASLSGAPIVPVLARRVGFFRYEVHVRPPIFVQRRADPRELARAASAAVSEIERFLQQNATQWFHFSG